MNIIPVKNILGWSAFVFCACVIIQLFCVMFFVFSAEHKSFFRLVINATVKKMACQWRKKFSALIQTRVFYMIYMFPPTIFTSDYNHTVKANCISLSKKLWPIFVFLSQLLESFFTLIKRFCCLLDVKIEGLENLISVNLFSFCVPLI